MIERAGLNVEVRGLNRMRLCVWGLGWLAALWPEGLCWLLNRVSGRSLQVRAVIGGKRGCWRRFDPPIQFEVTKRVTAWREGE